MVANNEKDNGGCRDEVAEKVAEVSETLASDLTTKATMTTAGGDALTPDVCVKRIILAPVEDSDHSQEAVEWAICNFLKPGVGRARTRKGRENKTRAKNTVPFSSRFTQRRANLKFKPNNHWRVRAMSLNRGRGRAPPTCRRALLPRELHDVRGDGKGSEFCTLHTPSTVASTPSHNN